MERVIRIALLLVLCATLPAFAAKNSQDDEEDDSPWSAKTFKGLELRGIGPALMSGRIADIAVHPEDASMWYVAAGSGGVWKTTNAGTSWKPIFDDEDSYSIGCVTLDPSHPEIVWVGSGENVGGRHVGYGDGVYKSLDGGASWENVGLEKGLECRVRRVAGAAVVGGGRSRSVQDDRRRQELGERLERRRVHGRQRPGDGPA